MNISDKIYLSLCTLFSVLIVMGNLIYQKFVSISIFPFYPLELSVGAILYPVTFMLTGLISEFFGATKVKFCIHLAICMNILIALIIIGMDFLEATEWSRVSTETFHKVFGYYNIAFIASLIACYIGQRLDAILYLWIHRITGKKWLWLRSYASSTLSLFVDTCIVIGILTLFSILPKERMGMLIIHTYLFKSFFIICCSPLIYIGFWLIQHLLMRSPKVPSPQQPLFQKYKIRLSNYLTSS
ncbi:MAG: queuosine precursor transporter [Alphaproteobacteria bacterium]|nr:queuosine precursor transporter [Alphaproteobacteria bacterium]